jgi:integrase
MFEVRQEHGSPFFTGVFPGPDGKQKEFSTKSLVRSVAQRIVMCWLLLSLAAHNRIMTKRQFMAVAKTLYYMATGIKIPNVTVREGAKLFLDASGQKEKETYKNRRATMSQFIEFLGVEADGIMEDAVKLQVMNFRDHLLKRNEPSTVNNRMEHLVTFFNFGIDLDWLEKNPAKGVKAKDPNAKRKSKVIRRPFRRHEAFLLVEIADVEMTGFFVTDFHLGARQGDASALTVPKLMDSAEYEGVDMEFLNMKGKRDMVVPTLPEYGTFMGEFLQHHPNPRSTEPLFWKLGRKKNRSSRNATVDLIFDDICQRQKLRDKNTAPIGKSGQRQYELVPHCIRHTTNMAFKLSNMPTRFVCAFLGHDPEANKQYDHFEETELMRQELYKAAGKKCHSKKATCMTLQDILDLTDYATEKLRRIRFNLPALTLDEVEAFLADLKAKAQTAPQPEAAQGSEATAVNTGGNA